MASKAERGPAPVSLLRYLPFRYVDCRVPLTGIRQAHRLTSREGKAYLAFRVETAPTVSRGPGMPRTYFRVTDGLLSATVTAFRDTGAWLRAAKVGETIHLFGEVGAWRDQLEVRKASLVDPLEQGRIVPRYRARDGEPSAVIEARIRTLLANPASLREAKKEVEGVLGCSSRAAMCDIGFGGSLEELLGSLHQPETTAELHGAASAARRLNVLKAVYDVRDRPKPRATKKAVLSLPVATLRETIAVIPFALTDDQRRAIWETVKELRADQPCRRLISGDVGTGKTIAYAVPLVCAQREGARVAVLTPNAILAHQIAGEIRDISPGTAVRLVVSGENPDMNLSGAPILVGTSALEGYLDKARALGQSDYQLDLLVVDEQQKMGVRQRQALAAEHTNIIEATATPIPRTAALLNYGNIGFSAIDQCPVEKRIKSKVVEPHDHRRAARSLLNVVHSGRQVAVIYPRRGASGERHAFGAQDKGHAEELARQLKSIGGTRVRVSEKELSHEDRGSGAFESHQVSCIAPRRKRGQFEHALAQLAAHPEEPIVSAAEERRLRNNVDTAWEAWDRKLPGLVGRIHGGMATEAKVAELAKMKSGEYRVMIATSAIEIGVTMPNLAALMVVNSDLNGASTLHQFRGRVARKGGSGLFLMHVDKPLSEMDANSVQRLKAVEKCNNGRELARLDLEQRGFGALGSEGVEQKGFLGGVFSGLTVTPADLEAVLDSVLRPGSRCPAPSAPPEPV